MDKINSYCTKKYTQLLSMIMGVGVIVFYILTRVALGSVSSLSGAFGMLKFVAIIFMILWIAYALMTALSLYYSIRMQFIKKETDVNHIVNLVIGAIMAVALLLNISTINFFFKVSSGDIWGMSMTTINSVTTAAHVLDFAFLVALGGGIYNAIMYFQQKNGNVSKPASQTAPVQVETKEEPVEEAKAEETTEVETPVVETPEVVETEATTPVEPEITEVPVEEEKVESVAAPVENMTQSEPVEVPEAVEEEKTEEKVESDPVASEPEKQPEEKKPSFLKTKKGKLTIGGIAVVVVALIAGMLVMSNKKTELNLTDKVEVAFEGFDGEGYATIESRKIEYDGDSDKVREFIDSVYFVVEGDDYDLSNGDTVKIVARYDEDLAKRNKVDPKGVTKEVKVKGLEIDYDDPADMSKAVLKKLNEAWDIYFEEYIDEEIIDDLDYNFDDDYDMSVSEKTLIGKYFINDTDYKGYDKIVYLVKASVKGKEYSFGDDEPEDLVETRYFRIEVEGVSDKKLKNLSEDDFSFSYDVSEFDSDEKAIEDLYDDYEDYWSDYEVIEIK